MPERDCLRLVVFERQPDFDFGLHDRLEQCDAVAPTPLGAVHRCVGFTQQIVRALMLATQRNATQQSDVDAGAGMVDLLIDVEWQGQCAAHLFGHGQGGARDYFRIGCNARRQDHESGAAQPGHGICIADYRDQPLRHHVQQGDAHRVPARIVNLLKVVEIDEHKRAQRRVAAGVYQRYVDPVHQQRAVWQAGQGVKVSEPLDVLPGQLVRRHIAFDRNRMLHDTVRRADRNHVEFYPDLGLPRPGGRCGVPLPSGRRYVCSSTPSGHLTGFLANCPGRVTTAYDG